MKTQPQSLQLSLWQEKPLPDHHHMQIVYYGGKREIICSAQPQKPYSKDEYSAQWLGGVKAGEYCPICHS